MTSANNNPEGCTENNQARINTSHEISHISVYGWVGLVISMLLLIITWDSLRALQWQIQSGLIWVLIIYESRRALPHNCTADGVLYPGLGVANRITILRGWFIAATGGFLFQLPPPGLIALVPAVFYTISAILDRIDGYAARKTRHVSQMGIELDTIFDALGLAVVPLLAVWYGKIHWTYLLVSCAYYLFIWGMHSRRKKELPVYPLKPKPSRRAIAGFQMGFVAVILFPVFQPPATQVAGFAFMLPVLVGFIIDWLIVSGRISDDTFVNHDSLRRGEIFIVCVTQPLLRLVLAVMVLNMFDSHIDNHLAQTDAIPMTIYAMVACIVLILLGVLGRLAALILVLLLGVFLASNPPGIPDYIVLTATIWIVVLGTGRFSLYTWDQDWVNRYDGKE